MHPITFEYILFTIQNYLSKLLPNLHSTDKDLFSAFVPEENESEEINPLQPRKNFL